MLQRLSLQRFLKRVNAHAGAAAALSDTQLQARIRVLGRQLQQHGLADRVTAEVFALVREAAQRILDKRHYDVQLIGGWMILRGRLAEMETGEGKTLTATLPACIAALAGMPVHVVTVNDYLVERDADSDGPAVRIRSASRSGTITEGMDEPQRARGLRLRRDLLHQQGAGLRLPAGPPRHAPAPAGCAMRLATA